jgi:hypothetical protein
MQAEAGDTIVVGSKRLAQPGRAGVVEEVFQQDPLRLRVRWQDGHTSVLAPTAGVAQISHPKKSRKS